MGDTRQYVARWRRTINIKTLRKEENKNQSVMRNFKPQEQEQFVCQKHLLITLDAEADL